MCWAEKLLVAGKERQLQARGKKGHQWVDTYRPSEVITRHDSIPLDSEPSGTVINLGRPDDDIEGKHIPFVRGFCNDHGLSRYHLTITKEGDTWILSGPDEELWQAKVQYWGTGREQVITSRDRIEIMRGEHLGVVIETSQNYYWALFSGDEYADFSTENLRIAPSRKNTNTFVRHEIDPSVFAGRGWIEAIKFRYNHFLAWPMYPQPKLTAFKTDGKIPKYDKNNKGNEDDHVTHDALKARLKNLCRSLELNYPHQYPLQGESLDIRLLEWLVANNALTLEQDRVEWHSDTN